MDAAMLATIPLFSRLDATELAHLAELLVERKIAGNQPIFWIGDVGEELFVVRSGAVQISYPDETGREFVLAVLKEGTFFGDISLLDGGARTASARTIDDSVLYSLKRSDFLAYLVRFPHAAIDVLTVLGGRQREILEKLRGVSNANTMIELKSTAWQKIADIIAMVSASQPFVMIHMIWFGAWMILNATLPQPARWDPYPYPLLTMIVSLEAIFLSIFVLISQNRAGDKDRIRADADYQVNLKAGHEVMQLHHKIDKLAAKVDKLNTRDDEPRP